MKTFLAGASGFIGRHILFALARRGHEVTCLVRGMGAETVAAWCLPGCRVVVGEFTQPENWLSALDGHDVVMNAVGIIRERGASTFDTVHRQVPILMFERAASAGVSKIVQISALGADETAQTAYHRSKRSADERLAQLGIPFVILRPSFVYGPGDHSMTFFASLAALPVTPIPGSGDCLVQPVAVEDLVEAVVRSAEDPTLHHVTVDIGGAAPIRFDALFDELARRLGKEQGARKCRIPLGLVRLVARTTDLLGGRGPITSDELRMLGQGNHCNIEPFVQTFGFRPVSLAVGLARNAPDAADRAYARLTHLRVPLRLSVAFIWLWTGLVSAFWFPRNESLARLSELGITGIFAETGLDFLCAVEVALGIATALGYRIRLLGAIQIAFMALFTVALSVVSPELWLSLSARSVRTFPCSAPPSP